MKIWPMISDINTQPEATSLVSSEFSLLDAFLAISLAEPESCRIPLVHQFR